MNNYAEAVVPDRLSTSTTARAPAAPQIDATVLERTIAEALQERALRPAVVRVELALSGFEPWCGFSLPGRRGEPVFAWNDPSREHTLFALGAVEGLECDGPSRFEAVQRWISSIDERCLDLPHGPLAAPLAVGGFSFAESQLGTLRDRAGPWRGWPRAAWFVPRILLERRGLATRAVLSAALGAGRWATARAAEALAASRGVLAGLAAPRAAGSEAYRPLAQAADASGGAARWRRAVIAAKQAIGRSELDKVVLARTARFEASPGTRFDPEATLRALRDRQRRSIAFLLERPGEGSFLGASPEILARVEGGRVETVALAGTLGLEHGAADLEGEAALLASPKDRAEQRIVAESIEATLRPIASAALDTSAAPEVVRHCNLLHLKTPIVAWLKPGVPPLEVIRRLHPTPAVAGEPREAALEFISAAEPADRGWYAGPIGWLGPGRKAALAVAIRSALIRQRTCTAYAGAGIVAASDPDAEWAETLLKLDTIESALALETTE
jgi:salicylate biosynthesis isochorismate synthase/menaquinone-specific isochorismate synthase